MLAPSAAPADYLAFGQPGRPALKVNKPLALSPAFAPEGAALRVMFLGATTLLLDDWETALLTDGFFSRPGRRDSLTRKIKPDQTRISAPFRQDSAASSPPATSCW